MSNEEEVSRLIYNLSDMVRDSSPSNTYEESCNKYVESEILGKKLAIFILDKFVEELEKHHKTSENSKSRLKYFKDLKQIAEKHVCH